MSFPIYVLLGTKAQYIKMAPLLRLMEQEGLAYHLIDTGQHAALSRRLRGELCVKEPDSVLAAGGNIQTFFGLLRWMAGILLMALFRPGRLRDGVFAQGKGLCLVHGDTASTLIGAVLAKRAGMKLAHVESGLRSFNLLSPFPEELIRIVCMRLSDILFAPSPRAKENLVRMRIKGRVYDTAQNTNVEAIHYALARQAEEPAAVPEPYCVFTIHRAETILSRRRLRFVLDGLAKAARRLHVVFIVHDATREKLRDYRLSACLEGQENVTCRALMGHGAFVRLIANAAFLVTDGGSIQEECHYLNLPCLVLRKETERPDGIGGNARLCGFDPDSFDDFLEDYKVLRGEGLVENRNPSRLILETIVNEVTL